MFVTSNNVPKIGLKPILPHLLAHSSTLIFSCATLSLHLQTERFDSKAVLTQNLRAKLTAFHSDNDTETESGGALPRSHQDRADPVWPPSAEEAVTTAHRASNHA